MPDYTIKRNDTGPDITATLSDADGVQDLTGASVKFVMRSRNGGTAKVDAAATIVEAASGTVKYTPIAADTDTAGSYLVEWTVTFDGGQVITFPNDGHQTLTVVEDLG